MDNNLKIVNVKMLDGAFNVDDDMLTKVENSVGIAHTGWDIIDPKVIISASICEFLNRYELKNKEIN